MMTSTDTGSPRTIAIIGGGPAGLAAAEVLSQTRHAVTIYEAMPTIGRKFLLAGKSGLNLTHSEDHEAFVSRFGVAQDHLRAALDAFSPADVRDWAAGLGSETFVGSSGRVFPNAMKASPLLRAWRQRLESRGVVIRTRWRWTGFNAGAHYFETPDGPASLACDAALLAFGGASWPKLGSDARWVGALERQGIDIAPFRPANCGFDVAWSDFFTSRFAGSPVKSVLATTEAGTIPGEFVISRHGIEGSLVYAHASALRDRIETEGRASMTLDLVPGRTAEALERALSAMPARMSFSNRLRKAANLDGVKAILARELEPAISGFLPGDLARRLKALPLIVQRPRPIAEAISSAGGVRFTGIDQAFMLKTWPGVFIAGEMIDWEAPTGGYLLTACMSTGRAAGCGITDWLDQRVE